MTDCAKMDVKDGVLEILFDRPPVNAINADTSRSLGAAFARLRDDDSLRVAIITAPGDRIFSAGWDLKNATAVGANVRQDHGPGGFAGLTEMFDLNKPIIAAVNGRAIGGGFELVLCCDIIVAAENADFALPETAVGVVADAGGLLRLPRRLPYHIAMDLLLTGRRMPAKEAAHFGLVNVVVPRAQLMDKAREYARLIADGAPLSVQATKEVIRQTESMGIEEAMRKTHSDDGSFPTYARMYASEDLKEGPRAFAEKRKPQWKGR